MVVLPDHLHMIWKLPDEDADYASRIATMKGTFSRRCGLSGIGPIRTSRRERGIWQKRFWEHLIRDEDDWNRHVDYIHWNPVKHGLTASATDWPWSSIHAHVRHDMAAPTDFVRHAKSDP